MKVHTFWFFLFLNVKKKVIYFFNYRNNSQNWSLNCTDKTDCTTLQPFESHCVTKLQKSLFDFLFLILGCCNFCLNEKTIAGQCCSILLLSRSYFEPKTAFYINWLRNLKGNNNWFSLQSITHFLIYHFDLRLIYILFMAATSLENKKLKLNLKRLTNVTCLFKLQKQPPKKSKWLPNINGKNIITWTSAVLIGCNIAHNSYFTF